MKKLQAIIERAKDGSYSIYLEKKHNFSLIGVGDTAHQAIEDFYNCYKEMQEELTSDGIDISGYEFVFKYDVSSFLSLYSKIISLAGLERLTGINQKQLGHYVSGFRTPSQNTVQKIELSLHKFGNELSQVTFI